MRPAIIRLLAPTIAILAIINPFGVVDLFARTRGTMLDDRTCLRADHDYGLRYRIALRTQGGRNRVLGGDDIVGHSAHSMVCTRHGAGGKPTTGFRHLGWSARLWSATDLPPIRLAAASTLSGKWRTVSHVLRGDVVQDRTHCTWISLGA
jgi:hypothetical protein